MQTLQHTKKYSLLGGTACAFWMSAVTAFLNSAFFLDGSFHPFVEYTLNLSLLPAMVLLIRCVFLLFRKRPLLQGNEQGLYLNLPPKNLGVVPWRCITGFALSPDSRFVQLYLQRTWDPPDRCSERFDIQTDARGHLMIPLPLGRKAGDPAKACRLLNQWLEHLGGSPARPPSPEGDEAAIRRIAGAKGRGASLLLASLHILRARFWLLWLLLFLLTAGVLQQQAGLSVLWALLIPALPFLFLGWLLRRFLTKGVTALQQYCEKQNHRSVGL